MQQKAQQQVVKNSQNIPSMDDVPEHLSEKGMKVYAA